MVEQQLIELVANNGFAIVIGLFLIRWITVELNKKLDTIIELQKQIADTQRQLVELQQKVLILVEARNR